MTKKNSGQAALIVILLTAVLVTVGVSTLARTVTDVRISRQVEDGVRARLAADGAAEIALYETIKQGNPAAHLDCPSADQVFTQLASAPTSWPTTCEVVPEESYYWYDVTEQTDGSTIVLRNIAQGDVVTLWLRKPDELLSASPSQIYGGNVTFIWEEPTTDVEFIVFSEYDNTDVVVKRSVFKINGVGGDMLSPGSFASGDPAGNDPDWMFIRIKPLSDDIDTMTIVGSQDFLPQGYTINAGGITTSGVQQQVQIFKRYDDFPPMFDYVLYAGTEIN